ncbi:MAG: chromate transporter [Candidatus Gastranaerophilales bacterium]|nr:chromate transporter [Candidatus Gastranaerophilales bacterium]
MNFSLFLLPPMILIFIVFLKIGFIFFGGGYVAIPVIYKELVVNLHLLTEQQFIDGTAISQLTPGPIAIIATFAGYCIAGVGGAVIGTFAMFLPGSILMFIISKNYEKIKNSIMATKILNKTIPAIVGLLISTSLHIGKNLITDLIGFFAFILSAILLIRFKVSPVILIFIFAIIGFLTQ